MYVNSWESGEKFYTIHVNLVPISLTIHKILVDDLLFENWQFYSIEKLNYIGKL
jgi:hypothetical protein